MVFPSLLSFKHQLQRENTTEPTEYFTDLRKENLKVSLESRLIEWHKLALEHTVKLIIRPSGTKVAEHQGKG